MFSVRYYTDFYIYIYDNSLSMLFVHQGRFRDQMCVGVVADVDRRGEKVVSNGRNDAWMLLGDCQLAVNSMSDKALRILMEFRATKFHLFLICSHMLIYKGH